MHFVKTEIQDIQIYVCYIRFYYKITFVIMLCMYIMHILTKLNVFYLRLFGILHILDSCSNYISVFVLI